jgi:hypothetical protein
MIIFFVTFLFYNAKILSLCCPLHADKSLIDGHAVQINVVLDENRE